MQGASLVRANLKGAVLENANLQDADLSYADLSFADLTSANLTRANLSQASLLQANLSLASLNSANLTGAVLELANLGGVDLRGASLVRAGVDGALFTGSRMEMTLLGDCDLSGALDLDAVQHQGPSIVGLDTLMRSRGMISQGFLRQAGVPQAFISAQRGLGDGPGDYHRVLLVGSIKDGAIIQQLQSDLRALGLSCWRWPVDDEETLLKDESLPLVQRLACYDQIVLVCSHHALESPYAWRLFEQIFHPDPPRGSHFRAVVQVTLDQSLRSQFGGLWEELRQQPAVDLSAWQENGTYQRGVDQLIALLRAAPPPSQSDEAVILSLTDAQE